MEKIDPTPCGNGGDLGLSERKKLRDEVAHKVEEIKKLTAELFSACDKLMKLVDDCPEETPVSAVVEEKRNPTTPDQAAEPTKKRKVSQDRPEPAKRLHVEHCSSSSSSVQKEQTDENCNYGQMSHLFDSE